MSPRPAPSAVRSDSSRRRPLARANSRLATFEHAMNSTIVDPAIISVTTSGTSSGRKVSRSVRMCGIHPSFVSGWVPWSGASGGPPNEWDSSVSA